MNENYISKKDSFTLLELLIVIGILAILATSAVVILNPAELLKQSRDTKRSTDLKALNSVLNLYNLSSSSYGDSNTIYISIPYATADCGYGSGNPLVLPSLPSGWSYACKPDTDYQKIDGTGWIPINLTQIESGAPFSALPIDPINNSFYGLYYNYVADSSGYVFASLLESIKYLKQTALTDGGSDNARFETGRNLKLWASASAIAGYWNFNEGNGLVVYDSSGNNNSGALTNGPIWTAGKVNGAINFDGVDDFVDLGSPAILDNLDPFTITMWALPNSLGGGSAGRLFEKAIIGSEYKRTKLQAANTFSALVSRLSINASAVAVNESITLGSWQFVAITFSSADGIRFYRAPLGGSVSEASYASRTIGSGAPTDDSTGNFTIGAFTSGSQSFDGKIDEVIIYNRVLFNWEIQALFNSTN